MIKFVHVRQDKNQSKGGGFTIAYDYPEQFTGMITWSLARCSPKDNFCKRIARNVALGRFDAGVVEVTAVKSDRYADIESALISEATRYINQAKSFYKA